MRDSSNDNSEYHDAMLDLLEDASDWYRREARREYELLAGDGYSSIVDIIGKADADHLVEDWRSMVVVCEKAEMLQGYCMATKTYQFPPQHGSNL